MIETLNWGSHLPALMACVAAGNGPVLEIGSGHFSTPCLHALCSAMNLDLVTTELEDSWRAQFEDYATPTHRVLKQTEELLKELATQEWGVVLVDDQAHTRVDRLNMFFNSAKYVLFHDANFPEYKQILEDWVIANPCNSRYYTRYGPFTLVVSKNHPIPDFQP
jgi:hypothetical protein